ncbi:MAG: methylmalonyl-CoA epimerase [Chloroflexi bacterium]|nr:methylmalonyl-CoA epimerase [Chloroflexota bacterium]
MIKKIHHVSVVVRNLEEALKLYEGLFGLRPEKIEALPEQGVRVALLPVGGSEIELVEPLDPNSGVGRFLESRGEGLHHICLEVDDVDRELVELEKKGVRLIDKKGRSGLVGKVAFIHPEATRGVLIELAQKV